MLLKKIKIASLAGALLSTALVLTSCGKDDDPQGGNGGGNTPVAKKNIVELAKATEGLDSLVVALKTAGLVETLSGKGPFTVFAPDNDAFADALSVLGLKSIAEINSAVLDGILKYHVTNGAVKSSELTEGQEIKMLNDKNVVVDLKDGTKLITIGQATGVKVTGTDVEASNGVVHLVEQVLLPTVIPAK